MTVKDLAVLYRRRNASLKALSKGYRPKTLGLMSHEERAEADETSRIFNAADRAIVAELKKLGYPFIVDGVELRLTSDEMNFAECDPKTGRVLYVDKPSVGTLFDYGDAERVKRMTDAATPRPVILAKTSPLAR